MQHKSPKGKGTGLACQVPGCKEDVPAEKAYYRKCRICPFHMNLPVFCMDGRNMRFCKLCRKFEDVRVFEGERRSCRESLGKHNARRRKRRHDGLAGRNQDGPDSDDQSHRPRLAATSLDTATTSSAGRQPQPPMQRSRPPPASAFAAQPSAGSALPQLPAWQLAEAAAAVADMAAAAARAGSLGGVDDILGSWLPGRSTARLPPHTQGLPHPPPPQWLQLLAAAAGTSGLAHPGAHQAGQLPLPPAALLATSHAPPPAGPSSSGPAGTGQGGGEGGQVMAQEDEEEGTPDLKPASGLDLSAHLGSLRLGELSLLMTSAGTKDAPEWRALLEEMSGLLDHMPGVRDKLLASGNLPQGPEEVASPSGQEQQQPWGPSATAGLFGMPPEQEPLPPVPALQQAHPTATIDLRRPLAWASAASLHQAQELEEQRVQAAAQAAAASHAAAAEHATGSGGGCDGSSGGPARKQQRTSRRSGPRSTSGPSLDAISEGREAAGDGDGSVSLVGEGSGGAMDSTGRGWGEALQLVRPGGEEAELLQVVEKSLQLGSLRLGDLSLLVNSLGARELSELLPSLLSEMSIPLPEVGEGAGGGQAPTAPQPPQQQPAPCAPPPPQQHQQFPSSVAIAAAARLLGIGQESAGLLPQLAPSPQLPVLHPGLSPQEQLQLLLLHAYHKPHQQQPPPPPGVVSKWGGGLWPLLVEQGAAHGEVGEPSLDSSSAELATQPARPLPPRGGEGAASAWEQLPRSSSGSGPPQASSFAPHQSPFAPQASSFQQSPFLSAFTAVQRGGASTTEHQHHRAAGGLDGPPVVTSYAPAPGVRSISFQRSSLVPYQSVNFERASDGVPPSPLNPQPLNLQLLKAAGYAAQQGGS